MFPAPKVAVVSAATTTAVIVSAVLGLLVGSFLNVVIARVPAGESVVKPRSRCPGCGSEIRSRDNVPVVSWLLLRARCRDCGEPISARYPLVEAGTAVVFALLAWAIGPHADLPAFLYLGAVGMALAAIDLDTKRLPNALTLPSYVVGLVLLAVAALVDDAWDDYARGLAGLAILYAVYFLLMFVYPGGMGFGDVKLAGVLGLYLAWTGWGALVVGAFSAFVLGGVFSIGLLVFRGAGRKTAIPFGPWMLLGAFVGLAWGNDIWDAYLSAAF